ncbi:MAG: UDP-galactopyranose/dTDP-fucopyranose mutase family protein [Burkholderiales bacterium]
MTKQIGIAGAGFAGAVLARELAITGKYSIEVFDERPHVAGNCYTSRDPSSGIMLHHYGPHIFNTSRQDVWDYVNQYATFGAYTNRVKAITARGVFSMPMNLLTINQFFGEVMNPAQAQEFLAQVGDRSIKEPRNFEEQALRFLGRELYENFFYGYTKKQWGVEPRELPAAILQRLPVRFNYDDNYYQQRYQGIPVEGYTAIVEKILDHPAIRVHVGQRLKATDCNQFDHLFWSGPLDSYFEHELGRLQYRSLVFERFDATGDYQGNAVINYCQETVPWTRIAEHKHFTPWELHENTVCYREYSKLSEDKDIPYYPLRLERDKSMLQQYMQLAEKTAHVTFIGRLGTYRYLDMHVVIGESLDLARRCLAGDPADWPKFSGKPLN